MGESGDVATGDSSGGLFLVLCLLGACTCVVGCAYNYAVLHKRGEEIVPGIGRFSRLPCVGLSREAMSSCMQLAAVATASVLFLSSLSFL